MKQAKSLFAMGLIVVTVLVAFAPEAVQASPRTVCHWNHHHMHRVCHRMH